MIEFAKFHVKACKEEILKKAYGLHYDEGEFSNPFIIKMEEDSINKCYSLEKIK